MDANSSGRLIQALRKLLQEEPGIFKHPVRDVSVIETHISWVLLTGDFAYKIKKPVTLGFCDFSTLEKRERFCREELRLNRRLAPHIYLDVVAISGTPERPQLDGSGTPIEFAVKMRQFPQHALLSDVLARGELLPQHVDQLASEIAELHSNAEVALSGNRFGSLSSIRDPMVENFEHLLKSRAVGPSRPTVERLKVWSEREFELRQETFTVRKRNGFVRECHGDLHLGNLILEAQRVTLFDCIEFNEDFRWIDVMNEVAFVVMDLEDRGRADLAHLCLNAYLERTGDYAGLAVLPFYSTYRAMVRAKVDCIRAEQAAMDRSTNDAAIRDGLADEFHRYLEEAERFTDRPRPVLIITHGLSGSGKTFGCQPLVEQLGAIRVRSDVERKRLADIPALAGSGSSVDEALYSSEMSRRTYARLGELAEEIVQSGFTAVVDGTFLRCDDRRTFRRLAEQLGVPFVILNFQAAGPTLRHRIRERLTHQHDASEANLEVLAQQIATRQALEDDERLFAVDVDTDQPSSDTVALTAIRSRIPWA